MKIDLARPRLKHIAPRRRRKVLAGPDCGQLLAQLRDVDLQGVSGGGRRVVPPEGIDQAVCGHGLVSPEHQGGEQDPLAIAGERHDRAVVPDQLEWTQEPIAHRCSRRSGSVRTCPKIALPPETPRYVTS